MLSMSVISLVLSLSVAMMSLHFFTKRLRFFNQPLPRVKSNIRRDWKISAYSSLRSLISRVSLESLSLRQLRLVTLKRRPTTFNSKF